MDFLTQLATAVEQKDYRQILNLIDTNRVYAELQILINSGINDDIYYQILRKCINNNNSYTLSIFTEYISRYPLILHRILWTDKNFYMLYS